MVGERREANGECRGQRQIAQEEGQVRRARGGARLQARDQPGALQPVEYQAVEKEYRITYPAQVGQAREGQDRAQKGRAQYVGGKAQGHQGLPPRREMTTRAGVG